MGKLRKNYLYGWSLYNFFQTLSSRPELFTPPPVFEAMRKVPPAQGPFVTKRKGELHFPDDQVRVALETESAHARQLATRGMTPVPWYFERRAIDDAVLRVKHIMRRAPHLSLKQAIAKWEQEHVRMTAVQRREEELVAEESARQSDGASQHGGSGGSGNSSGNNSNSGNSNNNSGITSSSSSTSGTISAFDSFRIMQMMRDMQIEHEASCDLRIMETERTEIEESEGIRRSEMRKRAVTPPGLSSGAQIRTFERDFQRLVEREYQPLDEEERARILRRKSGVEMLDYSHGLDYRLHPTTLRKIAAALEVERLVIDVAHLKNLAGVPSPAYDESYITPFDLFAVYIRAFDDSASEYQLYEDARLYRLVDLNDTNGYTLYIHLHRKFKDAFGRFLRLHEVHPDISSILAQLDLGFGVHHSSLIATDSGAKQETVLEQLGFEKPDFSALFDSLPAAPEAEGKFDALRKHQSKIEELFLLIKVGRMLRPGTLVPFRAVEVFLPETNPLKAEEIEDRSMDAAAAHLAPLISEMSEPGTTNLPLPGFQRFKETARRLGKRVEKVEDYAEKVGLSDEETEKLIETAMTDSSLDRQILEEEAAQLFDVSSSEGAAKARAYVHSSLLRESGNLNPDNIQLENATLEVLRREFNKIQQLEITKKMPVIKVLENMKPDPAVEKIYKETKEEMKKIAEELKEEDARMEAKKKERAGKLFSLGSLPKDKVSDKTTEIFKSLFELDDSTQ